LIFTSIKYHIFERIEKKSQIVTGKELAGFVSEPSLPSIPKPD
jgi:hypothetical protein